MMREYRGGPSRPAQVEGSPKEEGRKSRLSSATHQLRLSGHIQARPDLDSSEETQSSRTLGLKGVI